MKYDVTPPTFRAEPIMCKSPVAGGNQATNFVGDGRRDPSHRDPEIASSESEGALQTPTNVDVYFSADVETDGPVPGPYSMLSLALVEAGRFDGHSYIPAVNPEWFEAELQPISDRFDTEAIAVNGLDRDRLVREGTHPAAAMSAAAEWIRQHSAGGNPVLVAYPVSFDWTWLYWYFVIYSKTGSPFNHSRCFDIKTAFAVKGHRPISESGRHSLPAELRSSRSHTHRALDDAREQAEIFANIFRWNGK